MGQTLTSASGVDRIGRVRIVLQARTTSSRLPAKVLLPIAGIPLALLCALRLGCTGREVVLATSCESTDDVLASAAQQQGIHVVRGSLNDVLARFLSCVDDLADGDLVVRATADNPLPDGRFVDALLEMFGTTGNSYLGTCSPADGLPYGLSAEVFSVGALRQVAEASPERADREHVTSSLRKRAGMEGIVRRDSFVHGDLSHLRATIDTLDDYLAMASVFAEVELPITRAWSAFLPELPTARGESSPGPLTYRPDAAYERFMLGTAQLGSDYGITNRSGRPSDAEAARMISLAMRSGIMYLDTARAYGDAEARLGQFLAPADKVRPKLVTKLPRLDALPDDASTREVRDAVDAYVYGSCRDLRRHYLDVLMFHHSADMHRWNGAAMARVEELRTRGVLGAMGASVYSPSEAMACIADARITHLQIPFNLVDRRWLTGDFVTTLALRPDVRVHARSVFLQGLLINEAESWPVWFSERDEFVDRIKSLVLALGRKSAADLCVAYVRYFPWVTTLVLGTETSTQLDELISLFGEPALDEDQMHLIRSELPEVPERLLLPSLW
ncbi:MAG: aldo/keto reductase [Caldimonas sp.]